MRVSVGFLAVAVCAGLCFFLSLPLLEARLEAQQQPPVFRCGAGSGLECAYTIHDAHGSINAVLEAGRTHGYNSTLIGAQWCVSVGKPRAPTPPWPQCMSWAVGYNGNGYWQNHGIVHAGGGNG
jgi:hypothetical protein